MDKMNVETQLTNMVNPINAVKIAQFILDLDYTAIHERYYLDRETFIHWLKESLEHYLHPNTGKAGHKQIELLEHYLMTLLKAIKTILPCLTQEAQTQVRQFLVQAASLSYNS